MPPVRSHAVREHLPGCWREFVAARTIFAQCYAMNDPTHRAAHRVAYAAMAPAVRTCRTRR
jgi:hypothetical protein